MARIVELSPVFAAAASTEFHLTQGRWTAREQAARLAREQGHSYDQPASGGVGVREAAGLLAGADALILAPPATGSTGRLQPLNGEESGRIIGQRILDPLSTGHPGLHIVLVSHFLVGHGVAHRNAKQSIWGMHAVEAHLRAGRNPWTILRPTWLSWTHDPSYQTRLTQDRHADGLVSTQSIAAAVITAIEHPEVSAGRTASIYNLSIPGTGSTDLVAEFAALDRDFEAEFAERVMPA